MRSTDTTTAFAHHIINKSMTDPDFRTRLLADPRGVIEAEYGMSLPSSLTITVVEETPDSVFLVLPARDSDQEELTDAELRHVAGGDDDGLWSAFVSRCWPCI